uniref:GC-rich sequence DNA-binding factor 2 n=1 Tax=Callorhinchus milii TaxID=7868 RepID=A0A4W3IBK0_CALMI
EEIGQDFREMKVQRRPSSDEEAEETSTESEEEFKSTVHEDTRIVKDSSGLGKLQPGLEFKMELVIIKRILSLFAGEIPDTKYIQAARKRRETARKRADFIPLDSLAKDDSSMSPVRDDDPINDDELDDHERRIDFTEGLKTQRQRMAEEIGENFEGEYEDEEEDDQKLWEEQQIKRVNISQEVYRSHQREHEKIQSSTESSMNTIEQLEDASDTNRRYKFYREMGTYVQNLTNCLSEKILLINELESAMHQLLRQQATRLLQRRQEDQRMLFLLGQTIQYLSMLLNTDQILTESKTIFEDVHEDYCSADRILAKFGFWRHNFPASYYDAYIGLSLPKILNPLIRAQLIAWNPLEAGCSDLVGMPWVSAVEQFCHDEAEEYQRKENSDMKLLSTVIEKTIVPKIEGNVVENHFLNKFTALNGNRSINTDMVTPFIIIRISVEEDLLGNIFQWDGLLPEQVLQEVGLDKLLNRYILLALQMSLPGPDNIEKCKKEGLDTATACTYIVPFIQVAFWST